MGTAQSPGNHHLLLLGTFESALCCFSIGTTFSLCFKNIINILVTFFVCLKNYFPHTFMPLKLDPMGPEWESSCTLSPKATFLKTSHY